MTPKALHFDHRMPQWLHVKLVNYLQRSIRPDECQGDHHTVAFLEDENVDVREGLAWLKEHGATCDCEVVLNTHPFIDGGPSVH